MGIKIYKNVLPEDLIQEVFTYLDNNASKIFGVQQYIGKIN